MADITIGSRIGSLGILVGIDKCWVVKSKYNQVNHTYKSIDSEEPQVHTQDIEAFRSLFKKILYKE